MPSGKAACTWPYTKVTSAPARRQARAKAMPIWPDEMLVMPRTGSMASNVAPVVIITFMPNSDLLAQTSGNKSANCAASNMRPTPISPQACSPDAGSRITTPSSLSCCMLRKLAGLNHICTFIAGAMTKGQVRAATKLLMRLSAMPWAILAMVLAEAGAISITSASRVRLMWAMPLPPELPWVSSNTGLPLKA